MDSTIYLSYNRPQLSVDLKASYICTYSTYIFIINFLAYFFNSGKFSSGLVLVPGLVPGSQVHFYLLYFIHLLIPALKQTNRTI